MRKQSKRPLFNTATGDPHILKQLAEELRHRDTPRALKLGEQVAARLKQGQPRPPVTAPAAPPIPAREAPPPGIVIPRPDRTPDQPAGILAAWTALEALTPQTYRKPEDLAAGDHSCVAELAPGGLPWTRGERSRPKRQLFYQIVLGAIPNRVGTIHTVQGREAEAVILVLGAPMAAQHGARAWAAGTPNILNVAVSRAKRVLYVVGSHAAWAGIGHARELGHPAAMPKGPR